MENSILKKYLEILNKEGRRLNTKKEDQRDEMHQQMQQHTNQLQMKQRSGVTLREKQLPEHQSRIIITKEKEF